MPGVAGITWNPELMKLTSRGKPSALGVCLSLFRQATLEWLVLPDVEGWEVEEAPAVAGRPRG
jgi:hypothetical protein